MASTLSSRLSLRAMPRPAGASVSRAVTTILRSGFQRRRMTAEHLPWLREARSEVRMVDRWSAYLVELTMPAVRCTGGGPSHDTLTLSVPTGLEFLIRVTKTVRTRPSAARLRASYGLDPSPI